MPSHDNSAAPTSWLTRQPRREKPTLVLSLSRRTVVHQLKQSDSKRISGPPLQTSSKLPSSFPVRSGQLLNQSYRQGHVGDDSAELQDATVSSSGIGLDIHFLTFWRCPSLPIAAISTLKRCPERWLLEKFVTCPNHLSFHLQSPVEVPLGIHGSWSCSARRRLFCARSSRRGEVSSGTLFRQADFFSQSQHARSMSHSHRGDGKWQETFTTWTSLQSWWC